jgi:hypothetical protein
MPGNIRSLRWPLIAAGSVAVTALVARDPVVDGVTGETVSDVGLTLTPGYLLFAPIGAVYDHLSLLTDRQHIAVLLSLILLYVGTRIGLRLSQGPSSASLVRATLREVGLGAAAFVGLLAFYAYGVLGPRPMAALRAYDPNLVIVDFHSHTEMSHDGRPGLSIDDRRAWHDAAGFDLAYVTDHTTVETGHAILEAAKAALADNPERAGERISLLPGREVRYENQHVIVLGELDPTAGIPESEPWPVVIQTIPNNLTRVPVGGPDGRGGVQGIELVDADPRAFRQSTEERELIFALVDSLDLAVIAASNHHGWGRAAAAWNLVAVPGWQELAPAEVGRRIEALILRDRFEANRIVERPRLASALPGDGQARVAWMAVTALPRFVWHVLTSLTLAERVAWLGWIWLWGAWPVAVALVAGQRADGSRRPLLWMRP